jgi:hypothetical protein
MSMMSTRPEAEPRSVVRRDAEGNRRAAPDWESLTERLIREAQEDGRFDDLPGLGKPLVLDDDAYAGDMATANRMLRNAGAAPPWIESDKRVRALRSEIEALLAGARRSSPAMTRHYRRRLDSLLDAHDSAVRHLEVVAPGPRQHRPRLDRVELNARLSALLGGGSDRP